MGGSASSIGQRAHLEAAASKAVRSQGSPGNEQFVDRVSDENKLNIHSVKGAIAA
ncbi:MAG: hypothetical protein GDA56_26995 [Hormoscilla sp. GM7CHS1pb]|nr:hypothetical protein [Hormoscilla sp. GM7CHS1pb]